MDLETVKTVIADRGFVSVRVLCLHIRGADPLPTNWVETKKVNAEWKKTWDACGRLLRKLHKQGVLKVSRKSYFEPMAGQQPTEYKLSADP